ncbi:MAG: hypothetical protein J0I16_21180 [Rhizobiales bacterium]|nr:hypothetical protein [Hyphomicrobiales bacterium]
MLSDSAQLTLVELAFVMARDGQHHTLEDIFRGLVAAGHSRARVREYLTGSLARQLSRICRGEDGAVQYRRHRHHRRQRMDRSRPMAPHKGRRAVAHNSDFD